jgi:hypothetical protein
MKGLATTPRLEARRGDQLVSQRTLGVRAKRPLPKADPILVTKVEAARVLGMSLSHFQRHVQDQIKCVYSGQLTLYDYADLNRWAQEEATIDGRAIA